MKATLNHNSNLITHVWDLCTEAYSRCGIRLSFPKGTPPEKTYQWRYIIGLVKKFEEWQFDEHLMRRFIEIIASYSKQINMSHKGLAIFHQKNILEVCYKKLLDENSVGEDRLSIIREAHNWLLARSAGGDVVKYLLYRGDLDAYCNLTIAFKSNKLPDYYLALSKYCMAAIMNLSSTHSSERSQLPSYYKLFEIRENFAKDRDLYNSARTILQFEGSGVHQR